MEEIICYTEKIPSGQWQYLSFWDILLDDTWAAGSFSCPNNIYPMTGSLNRQLHAKQNYEFLLRAALHAPVRAVGIAPSAEFNADPPAAESGRLPDTGLPERKPSEEDSWEGFRTDCYIIGKYQQMLLEEDYFNPAAASLLELAGSMPWKEQGIAFLEKMISHSPEFYAIDSNTCPILIYKETDMCCNLLNRFADQLRDCFLSRGQRVEIFDASVEGAQALTRYIGRHFKAVLGIQSYLFSIRMQDGVTNLHDLIHGPKFNLIMDHPAWLKDHITNAPKDYCLLIHDRNYIRFAKRYYPNVRNCLRFPLGGFLPAASCTEKQYDITFIATYRDYRERLKVVRKYDRKYRFLAARYLSIMKNRPDLPADDALRMALEHYHLKTDDPGFLNLFYDMRQVCFAVFLYFREKIIYTLLTAGITVHVFDESWQASPFAGHPCLILHPSVEASESLQIMQQSRISLNVMSWHKDGLTERVLNAMVCGSAVLTDQSTALKEEFEDNTDILMFSLNEINRLPARVKSLLSPEKEGFLQSVAERGRKKAMQKHLWQHRADMLLALWDTPGSE